MQAAQANIDICLSIMLCLHVTHFAASDGSMNFFLQLPVFY